MADLPLKKAAALTAETLWCEKERTLCVGLRKAEF
jgi:hypothetical protein